MYLGLTGLRMHAADTLYAGIGDFYMESRRNEELLDALTAAHALDERAVNELLKSFTSDTGVPPLAAHREEIDRCFAGDSVEVEVSIYDVNKGRISFRHR